MDGEVVNPIVMSDNILPRCECGNRRLHLALVAYSIERRRNKTLMHRHVAVECTRCAASWTWGEA